MDAGHLYMCENTLQTEIALFALPHFILIGLIWLAL